MTPDLVRFVCVSGLMTVSLLSALIWAAHAHHEVPRVLTVVAFTQGAMLAVVAAGSATNIAVSTFVPLTPGQVIVSIGAVVAATVVVVTTVVVVARGVRYRSEVHSEDHPGR